MKPGDTVSTNLVGSRGYSKVPNESYGAPGKTPKHPALNPHAGLPSYFKYIIPDEVGPMDIVLL